MAKRILKLSVISLALSLAITAVSGATAMATSPSDLMPTNGSVNLVTRTITVEYGQAPYSSDVVNWLESGDYLNAWINSKYVRATTPVAVNNLLTRPYTRNVTGSVCISRLHLKTTGKIIVRHALTVSSLRKTSSTFTVSGTVKPAGGTYVKISIQRKYFGVWITRQTKTIKTGSDGRFTAKLTGKYSTSTTYRVVVTALSDSTNGTKSVTKYK